MVKAGETLEELAKPVDLTVRELSKEERLAKLDAEMAQLVAPKPATGGFVAKFTQPELATDELLATPPQPETINIQRPDGKIVTGLAKPSARSKGGRK
jgi:hypothetical protein